VKRKALLMTFSTHWFCAAVPFRSNFEAPTRAFEVVAFGPQRKHTAALIENFAGALQLSDVAHNNDCRRAVFTDVEALLDINSRVRKRIFEI
jgi:hypothetical protein